MDVYKGKPRQAIWVISAEMAPHTWAWQLPHTWASILGSEPCLVQLKYLHLPP